jgi:hypothetical protein
MNCHPDTSETDMEVLALVIDSSFMCYAGACTCPIKAESLAYQCGLTSTCTGAAERSSYGFFECRSAATSGLEQFQAVSE